MKEVYTVRAQGLQQGRDTFAAIRAHLERLTPEALDAVLAEIESRKSSRPKKRENKISLVAARICQGDAFLTM